MMPALALPTVQAAAPATQLSPLLGTKPVAIIEGPQIRSLVTGRQLEATLGWLPPLPASPAEAADARRAAEGHSLQMVPVSSYAEALGHLRTLVTADQQEAGPGGHGR